MRYSFFAAALFLVMATSFGCSKSQTVKDSWRFTTKQYRTYLNTPVTLDMEDTGSCEPYELTLGEALLAVDDELQKLIRAMENSDHNPDQTWVMSMMQRFPWLSGLALVDGSGKLVSRYPEHFPKEFDVLPLMAPDLKQRVGDLRAYLQKSSAGPEIYVAQPVLGGDEIRGLIVAYFDPQSLITISPDPGSFAITSPAGLIWPGAYGENTTITDQNWENILKRKSCGVIDSKGSGFFWTTRYLGNLPLVYAVPVSISKTREVITVPSVPSATPQKEEDAKNI